MFCWYYYGRITRIAGSSLPGPVGLESEGREEEEEEENLAEDSCLAE